MLLDDELLGVWRDRVSHGQACVLLQQAWWAEPRGRRAALAAATGDYSRAAAIDGEPWSSLANGDIVGALRGSRSESGSGTPVLALAEAEALVQAGAVVAGLERLASLHQRGFAAATIALARHCYRFGDHDRAITLARALPGHAHVALAGAKAALIKDREAAADALLEPYLKGLLPLPDALECGAFAAVAASLLARRREFERLRGFATELLAAADAPPEMAPSTARVAWSAGLAGAAWERFDPKLGPWASLARLELALLAGSLATAERLMEQVGALGAPSEGMLALLGGARVDADEAAREFAEGRLVHVWRTHPHRWQPWIDALEAVPAEVVVCDLGRGDLPDEEALPDAVLDDGALVSLVAPRPPPAPAGGPAGVWIERPLCEGIGVGHDWPDEETAALVGALGAAGVVEDPSAAGVWVVGADTALAHSGEGRSLVVVAPPGDPFWAGPLPETAWPDLRVARSDPRRGWRDAGARVAELALALVGRRGPRPP